MQSRIILAIFWQRRQTGLQFKKRIPIARIESTQEDFWANHQRDARRQVHDADQDLARRFAAS